MEDPMKRMAVSFGAVVLLLAAAAIPARAQSHELLQGTQVHLRLLTSLTTAVAKNGDPFVAEVAQPIYLGSQIILPAGGHLQGVLGRGIRPPRFSLVPCPSALV